MSAPHKIELSPAAEAKAYDHGRDEALAFAESIRDRPDLSPRQKRRLAAKWRKPLEQKHRALARKLAESEAKIHLLETKEAAFNGASAWACGDLVLQRNNISRMHRVVGEWRKRNVIVLIADDEKEARAFGVGDDFFAGAQSFVIQHDWAKPFAGKMEQAEFILPYPSVCFEFRVSGKTVFVLTNHFDGSGISAFPILEWENSWVALCSYFWAGARFAMVDGEGEKDFAGPLMDMIGKQIRSICIALDAEVAETEVIRAPYRLNRAREQRGRLPIYDYHVVSLANRKRHSLPDEHRKHRSPRLHFRRGHWRHFEDHKTWIRWMLVGDPDLGFIDKEYRL